MGSECSCLNSHSEPTIAYNLSDEDHGRKSMQSHHAPESGELLATPEKAVSFTDARRSRAVLAQFSDGSLKQEDSTAQKAGAALMAIHEVHNEEQSSEPAANTFALPPAFPNESSHQETRAKGPPQLLILSSEEIAEDISHPKLTKLRQQLGRLYLDPLDPSVTVYKLGPVRWNSYIYVSEWTSEGKPYGRGCIFAPHEFCYEGYIVDGRKEVFGRLIFADGSYYMGCFSNDHAEGQGKYIQESGVVLEGLFSKGRILQGIETRPDGFQYKGEFLQWKPHGTGRLVKPDDSHYTGQFAHGQFNGKGTLVMASGNRYEGQWRNDKMHGKGRFTWTDGSVYQGQYADDQKHGYGEHTAPDGTCYRGGWKNGKRHGEGEEERLDHHGKPHRRQRTWVNGVVAN